MGLSTHCQGQGHGIGSVRSQGNGMTWCDRSKFWRLLKISCITSRKGICVLDCDSINEPFFPVGPYTQPILLSDTVGVGKQSGECSLLTKGTDTKEGRRCHPALGTLRRLK